MKNKWVYGYNAIVTTFSFICLTGAILLFASAYAMPLEMLPAGDNPPSSITHIDDWFNYYYTWSPYFKNLDDFMSVNGWIIVQQSFIILGIVATALFMVCFFVTLKNYFRICDNEKFSKIPLSVLSIFGFIFFWKWISYSWKNKSVRKFSSEFFGNYDSKIIDHKKFFRWITRKEGYSYRSLLTLFAYFLLISTILSVCLIPVGYLNESGRFIKMYAQGEDSEIIDYINKNPIDEELLRIEQYGLAIRLSPVGGNVLYFTQLTNFGCFIYAVILMDRPRSKAFINNSFTISVCTYILVVGIVFWTILFPTGIDNYKDNPLPLFVTIVHHGVVPVMFTAFTICKMFCNRVSLSKYSSSFVNFIIYPLAYGVLLYGSPFFTKLSVYGEVTNANPNNQLSINIFDPSSQPEPGNYYYLAGIILFLIIFTIGFSSLWALFNLRNKKNILKLKIAEDI